MTNRNELERFVAAYNDYCAGEFGNDAITIDEAIRENELGVLYTTAAEDDEYNIGSDAIEYQVSYFLDKMTLEYFIDGNQTMAYQFESMEEMLNDIKEIDFDSLYCTIDSMLYAMLDEGTAIIKDNELVYA